MKKKLTHLTFALILGLILGTHKGFIAIWETGNTEPMKTFPVAVSSLPPADQAALQRGIPIDSAGALAQLLEDYLS
jgi:hypothetical protein